VLPASSSSWFLAVHGIYLNLILSDINDINDLSLIMPRYLKTHRYVLEAVRSERVITAMGSIGLAEYILRSRHVETI
jgi:hypothetical protein